MLGDPNNSTDVCYIAGRPTIKVKSHNTEVNWLFDTGAAVSVISEDLFLKMHPKPKLSKVKFKVTGANQSPLAILGKAELQVNVLDEPDVISALVCQKLSQTAILGMDAIEIGRASCRERV